MLSQRSRWNHGSHHFSPSSGVAVDEWSFAALAPLNGRQLVHPGGEVDGRLDLLDGRQRVHGRGGHVGEALVRRRRVASRQDPRNKYGRIS